MASRLVIATNNAGKLREIRALLQPLEILSPADLDLNLEVEETGDTFIENARLKATAFAQASGLVALADDSGLEVDALEGAPGVLSARYGTPDLNDQGRCQLLLHNLKEHTDLVKRTARFRCAMVATAADGRSCHSEGACDGLIASAPAGDGGFGYDPVFYLPQFQQTMAQVDAKVKNKISHRSQALNRIIPLLLQTFAELRS